MTTSELRESDRVINVHVTDESLTVHLADGRAVTVPLWWYPRLANASHAQRDHWRIAGGGYGIHWPEIDEDLSVTGILRGVPAPGVHVPLRSAG